MFWYGFFNCSTTNRKVNCRLQLWLNSSKALLGELLYIWFILRTYVCIFAFFTTGDLLLTQSKGSRIYRSLRYVGLRDSQRKWLGFPTLLSHIHLKRRKLLCLLVPLLVHLPHLNNLLLLKVPRKNVLLDRQR